MDCPKCSSKNLEIVKSGPHQKLVCSDCMAFVKFMKTADVKTFKQLKDKEKKEMKVVNMKDEKADVKIDRSSILGNPFKIGKDGTREQVIQKYRKYLINCFQVVGEIQNMAYNMEDNINLGCHCKPKECHGDILIEAIKAVREGKRIGRWISYIYCAKKKQPKKGA